jgi:Family of unknown function (DUF5684)
MQQDSGGGSIFGLIIPLAIIVLMIASLWRVFTKAGQPGWAAIIPIYNAYVLCKIGGKPGWWVILLIIPVVNLVISLLVSLGVAQNFGKGAGFGIGLWLLSIIFYPILAFGDASYGGSPAPAAAAAAV